MKWIKYVLYTWGLWRPVKLKDKIYIVSKLNIDIYRYRLEVITVGYNIYNSISRIENILKYDYINEYVINQNTMLPSPRRIMLYKWYSDDGNIVIDNIWVKWLQGAYELNDRFQYGLSCDATHIAYRNSIKIEPLIQECNIILSRILDQ